MGKQGKICEIFQMSQEKIAAWADFSGNCD